MIEEPESRRAFVRKKDKRRWCKGKVGVPHDYQPATPEHLKQHYPWVDTAKVFMKDWKIEVCSNCGKERWR